MDTTITNDLANLHRNETIKTEISEDMYSVPDESIIEVTDYTVDSETGEVKEAESK